MSNDAPVAVDLPAADRDNPGWVKIGAIAAIGFVLGVAWPRVMGVRLGPPSPGAATAVVAAAPRASDAAPPGSAAPASASSVGSGPSAKPAAALVAPVAAPAAAATAVLPPAIALHRSSILSCRTEDGDTKKGKECGTLPALDQLVGPRIRKLAACTGAEGQTGKLSLVVNVDFGSDRFTYDVGKSTTLSNVDPIAKCLKANFDGVDSSNLAHEHPRYTVAYTAIFGAAGEHADKPDAPAERTERRRSR